MKFIDINTEYKIFQKDINYSINKVIKKSNFILGSEVNELENKLAKFNIQILYYNIKRSLMVYYLLLSL